MADLNDRELVERACDGESGAFDALVQRYRGDMCRLADGYLKGAADAEDVVQESFSEAFRRLSDLREPERFAAWLQSIVRNGSLSHLRNRRVYISYEEIASEGRSQIQVNEDYWGGSPFLAPDEYLARSEERHFVRAAVEKLSEKSRSAMALHYFEDKSYEEMAEELAVPISTIEGRLYRARKQLKEELLKMAKADMDEMALEKVIDEATKDLKDEAPKLNDSSPLSVGRIITGLTTPGRRRDRTSLSCQLIRKTPSPGGSRELIVLGTNKISGFSFDHTVEFNLSGASRVSGRFNSGDIRCVASGISSVSLQGKGGNLVVRATGASKINLGEFACIDADIRLSGVSQGTVHSEGVLNARLDDAARLWYVGKPQLGEIVTRGIGRVVRVDD